MDNLVLDVMIDNWFFSIKFVLWEDCDWILFEWFKENLCWFWSWLNDCFIFGLLDLDLMVELLFFFLISNVIKLKFDLVSFW